MEIILIIALWLRMHIVLINEQFSTNSATLVYCSCLKILSCWQQPRLWLKSKWDLLSNSCSTVGFWSSRELLRVWATIKKPGLICIFFERTAWLFGVFCHSYSCLFSSLPSQMPASEHGQKRVVLSGCIVMWNETDSTWRLCLNTLTLSILKWKWFAWMLPWHCASHRWALISF